MPNQEKQCSIRMLVGLFHSNIVKFYENERFFLYKTTSFYKKKCIRPPYRKLKPLKPGFIENSNFENNRDPCQPHRGGQSLFYDRPSCFRKLHSNFSGNLQISRAWIIDEPWIFPGPVYFQVLGNFRGLGQLNPLEISSKLEITRGGPLENFRWR